MITDDVAKELHDRATRGMALSAAEQAELDAWYARQDAEESARLTRTHAPDSLAALRAQVDEAISELWVVTQQVQALSAENESVRREVAELQRQLPDKVTSQPT
jgi:hypothetical protein